MGKKAEVRTILVDPNKWVRGSLIDQSEGEDRFCVMGHALRAYGVTPERMDGAYGQYSLITPEARECLAPVFRVNRRGDSPAARIATVNDADPGTLAEKFEKINRICSRNKLPFRFRLMEVVRGRKKG